MLIFSERSEDGDAYEGRLALKVPPRLMTRLQDGRHVIITGSVEGREFSMACPPTVYAVTSIQPN